MLCVCVCVHVIVRGQWGQREECKSWKGKILQKKNTKSITNFLLMAQAGTSNCFHTGTWPIAAGKLERKSLSKLIMRQQKDNTANKIVLKEFKRMNYRRTVLESWYSKISILCTMILQCSTTSIPLLRVLQYRIE